MGEFSIAHVLILSVILLIFFGPSRLPALGQSIGKAIKGFKQGLNEADNETTSIANQISENKNDPIKKAAEEKKHQNTNS
jgi:TatA/E family protein of Tat protein translocase